MDQREMIGDQQEALHSIVETALLDLWTCLPGIIQSYDPVKKLCTVQPAITMQTLQINSNPSSGSPQTVPIPITIQPMVGVPLVFIGGGGLVLETEPQQGDECLVIFSSRNIDGWWTKGGVQMQMNWPRHHSLLDGFAIVGPRSMANQFASLGAGMRLRTVDGTAYVELLTSGKVNMVAPGGISITGDVSVTGKVTATKEGTFDSIPVSTHLHSGVTTGASNTGEPTT